MHLFLMPATIIPNGMESVVILFVALLLFGKRMPEAMHGLGSSVRAFREGMDAGTGTVPTDRGRPEVAPDAQGPDLPALPALPTAFHSQER